MFHNKMNRTRKKIILDNTTITKKLNRMAYQILESNYNEETVILIGIANKGLLLAKKLSTILKRISDIEIKTIWVKMNKRNPLEGVTLEKELDFNNKSIIIIDDVGNTGRTVFYAMQPLYQYLPKKIQTAVLVDRKHKSYPIKADFVGLELATTLDQEVIVDMNDKEKVFEAYLT